MKQSLFMRLYAIFGHEIRNECFNSKAVASYALLAGITDYTKKDAQDVVKRVLAIYRIQSLSNALDQAEQADKTQTTDEKIYLLNRCDRYRKFCNG